MISGVCHRVILAHLAGLLAFIALGYPFEYALGLRERILKPVLALALRRPDASGISAMVRS
jgi:hypothetical protein